MYYYTVTTVPHPLIIALGYRNTLPGEFMFEVRSDDVVQDFVESIPFFKFVKQEAIHSCPFCGHTIFTTGDSLMCLNIGCLSTVNNKSAMMSVAKTLVPDIPINILEQAFDHLVDSGRLTTIVDVIQYLNINANSNQLTKYSAEFMMYSSNITLSNFLSACTVFDLAADMDLVISYYGNSLFKMMLDADTGFTGLLSIGIGLDLVVLLASIMNVNARLLDVVFPLLESSSITH